MVGNKVVGAFRQLLSLALVAALTLMNVQAAELHVHAAADHIDEAHSHGPAAHHHDNVDDYRADTTAIAGVDADDTVVHVAVVVAAPQSAKVTHAEHVVATLFAQGVPLIVNSAGIVARAHGPPSLVRPSLRAPPALLSL
jgi:hypothetical protein